MLYTAHNGTALSSKMLYSLVEGSGGSAELFFSVLDTILLLHGFVKCILRLF